MRLEIARLLPSASDSPNELYLSFLSELTIYMESVARAVNSWVGRDARSCWAHRASCVVVGRTYAAPFEERPGRAASWYRARVLQILVPGPSALTLCSSSSSISFSFCKWFSLTVLVFAMIITDTHFLCSCYALQRWTRSLRRTWRA